MSRRLLLLRHGQTDYNATQRMQGHLNTQLSEVGVAQARRVAAYFDSFAPGQRIGTIISSDLDRAHDTAQEIAKVLGLEVQVDARLRETDLGQWQEKSHAEVDSDFPGARAVWRHDATWAPPGGESRLDVARRARPVIDEAMQQTPYWQDATVLVVAHGGTISALTSHLLDLDVSQYPMFSGLGNTCWSQLTARPAFDADAAHLAPVFNDHNVADARWYLDAWNMGIPEPPQAR